MTVQLMGLRTKCGDSFIQHSFWANETLDEQEMWRSALEALSKLDNPQLIHYGGYESTFLKRMRERYCETLSIIPFVDKLINESVNLLSIIYAQIYFPTYSNGLKEIVKFLGFQWSEINASGFRSLLWRGEWEQTRDPSLQQKLITYNAEDCEALEKVAGCVSRLCSHQQGEEPPDDAVVHIDSLKRESPYRFQKNNFDLPELEYINQAAYWNYQRDKVYVRSSKHLNRVSRMAAKRSNRELPINKVVECK